MNLNPNKIALIVVYILAITGLIVAFIANFRPILDSNITTGILASSNGKIINANDELITSTKITGFQSQTGNIESTDSILTAIEKLNGNFGLDPSPPSCYQIYSAPTKLVEMKIANEWTLLNFENSEFIELMNVNQDFIFDNATSKITYNGSKSQYFNCFVTSSVHTEPQSVILQISQNEVMGTPAPSQELFREQTENIGEVPFSLIRPLYVAKGDTIQLAARISGTAGTVSFTRTQFALTQI